MPHVIILCHLFLEILFQITRTKMRQPLLNWSWDACISGASWTGLTMCCRRHTRTWRASTWRDVRRECYSEVGGGEREGPICQNPQPTPTTQLEIKWLNSSTSLLFNKKMRLVCCICEYMDFVLLPWIWLFCKSCRQKPVAADYWRMILSTLQFTNMDIF